jgi:hypothetical protein
MLPMSACIDSAHADVLAIQHSIIVGMAQRLASSKWVISPFRVVSPLTNTRRESPSDYIGLPRDTYGRQVYYDIPDPKLKQATQWLISNPNRINLGRIGLKYKGSSLDKTLITAPRQELDVWSGVITSSFSVDGELVKVSTQGDFDSDAVAFNIESDLVERGDLSVEFDFPYPPIHTTQYKYEVRSRLQKS